jgi:putative aldouronate transport system permease protein
VLQYAVGHWHSYFNAFIYLTNMGLYPRRFLKGGFGFKPDKPEGFYRRGTAMQVQGMADLLKYALIVVSTVPILCVYPFVQKYFAKNIMVGSLKG